MKRADPFPARAGAAARASGGEGGRETAGIARATGPQRDRGDARPRGRRNAGGPRTMGAGQPGSRRILAAFPQRRRVTTGSIEQSPLACRSRANVTPAIRRRPGRRSPGHSPLNHLISAHPFRIYCGECPPRNSKCGSFIQKAVQPTDHVQRELRVLIGKCGVHPHGSAVGTDP